MLKWYSTVSVLSLISPVSPHALKQAAAAKKTEIFERAERYVKEYRAKENDSIRFRREAKAAGNIHVPAEVGHVPVHMMRN